MEGNGGGGTQFAVRGVKRMAHVRLAPGVQWKGPYRVWLSLTARWMTGCVDLPSYSSQAMTPLVLLNQDFKKRRGGGGRRHGRGLSTFQPFFSLSCSKSEPRREGTIGNNVTDDWQARTHKRIIFYVSLLQTSFSFHGSLPESGVTVFYSPYT
jgi:hypothetical protein